MTKNALQVFPRRLSHERVLGVLEATDEDVSVALYSSDDAAAHERQPGREVRFLTMRAADSIIETHAERPSGEWVPVEGVD